MPNNRQWASLFWLVMLAVWALSQRGMRASVRDVLRTAITPKISLPLLVLAVWVVGLIAIAAQLGIWSADRLTDTVFWFVTAGVVLFSRFNRVHQESRFVRRAALDTLKVGAFVQAASELFVLNLFAELALQPVVTVLVCLSVVAARRPEHGDVKRLVDALIAVGGLCLLAYVSVSLVNNWSALSKPGILQQLALPVWLTLGVLPYVYCMGLFAAYELAFMRIDWKSKASPRRRMVSKVALLLGLHVRARRVGEFTGPWQIRLAETGSFREARRVMTDFSDEHSRRADAA